MVVDPIEKIREIFLQARELPAAEREAFLSSASRNDENLRREVEQLLVADRSTTMTAPAVDSEAFPALDGYQILGRLGEGGMGVVWKAVQLSTHRPAAIKLLSAASFGSERARLRFEREIELTAKLDHPHIARIYDSGLQRGTFFYAMQLIRGEDLDQYTTAHKLSRRQTIELMELICRAVQHAHQKGVIHRDLKHSNILVDDKGEPHVLDFGLAKAMDSSQLLSMDGEIAGTPAFMSPEQAAGKTGHLDTRCDVYSLGVILFHLLCGKYPHDVSGSAIEVMRRIAEKEPKRLGDIEPKPDKELQALLAKALEKEPERRYASAGEMADDLRRYLNHDPLVAQPPTLSYLLKKKLRRHRIPLGVAAAVAALLIGAVVYAYAAIFRERNTAIAAVAEMEFQRLEAERRRDDATRERTKADMQRHRATEAIAALRETAPAFYERCQTLAQERDFAEALKNALFAVDLAPDEAAYHLARGNMLESLGQFGEAVQAYDAATARQPTNVAAQENRELCLRFVREQASTGDLSLASLAQWQSVLEREKRFPEAAALLIRRFTTGSSRGDQVEKYTRLLDECGIKADLKSEADGISINGFSGKSHDLFMLRGLPVTSVRLEFSKIDDLTPLAGMPLTWLDIEHTAVSDLRPLAGMKLRELRCESTKISDLSPLSGMPLKTLKVGHTEISDLTPLRGMSLIELSLNGTRAKDLSPLRGMPLRWLGIHYCDIDDLTPLSGMPLEYLQMAETKVRDLTPLRKTPIHTLFLSNCSISDLHVLAGLPITHLYLEAKGVRDIRPLRSLPLQMLRIAHDELQPIEILKDLPQLRRIEISSATPADVRAVASLPVTNIQFMGNLIDISPLRGKPIEELGLQCPDLTDLTPIEGMPLKAVLLGGCTKLRNLSVLRTCPALERLSIPAECRDIEFLRKMPSIKRLEFNTYTRHESDLTTTAEEFWKQYDARMSSGKQK